MINISLNGRFLFKYKYPTSMKLGVTGTDILSKKISGGSRHQKEVLVRFAKRYDVTYFPDPVIYSDINQNKIKTLKENAKFFEDNGVKITDAFYKIIEKSGKNKFELMDKYIKESDVDAIYNMDYLYALYHGLKSGYLNYTRYLSKLLDSNYGICIQGLGDINNHLFYSFYSFSYLSAKMGKYFFYPYLEFVYDYFYIKEQLTRLNYDKNLKFIALLNPSQKKNINLKARVPIEVLYPSNGFMGYIEAPAKKDNKIIYYSRLNFMKGLLEIPYIFKKISERIDVYLEVIGKFNTKYEEDEFFSMIKKLGLTEKIKYKGYLPDEELREELKTSMLLLYPSHSDSFSLVILEALSYSVPVVAYDIPGLSYFKGFSNVKMVKEFDINSMAAAALNMLKDSRFSELNESEKKFIKIHVWDNVAMEHSRLIDKYLFNK
ncbi:glycosyltransferase [Acidiplasma sp.]|uniref:glycosyltransferase n=1 Tax=Acidiplasma sp. TaxID=1872114 RepID=UPI0025891939|nr:glycosyltransferase [Acidiplasma sp.]